MPDNDLKLVYSTGQIIPPKGNKIKKDICTYLPPSEQKVIVRHDRKGRGGKSVTVVDGIQLPQNEMHSLLKQLKAKLGTGGAIKDSSIEIQGEHCDKIMAGLEKMGYRPKRSGG